MDIEYEDRRLPPPPNWEELFGLVRRGLEPIGRLDSLIPTFPTFAPPRRTLEFRGQIRRKELDETLGSLRAPLLADRLPDFQEEQHPWRTSNHDFEGGPPDPPETGIGEVRAEEPTTETVVPLSNSRH